jgi:hypothetical protein
VKRRLFNLAAAVSLVLCVAVCVLWVRSYTRLDSVTWIRFRTEGGSTRFTCVGASTSRGRLMLRMSVQPPEASLIMARRYGDFRSGFSYFRRLDLPA